MKCKIKIPATSANIGSGFDTMGIALNLYNTFEISTREDKKIVITGVDKAYRNEDNLVITSIWEVLERAGIKREDFPGITMLERVSIPLGAGLGSSATCVAAGVIAGNLIAGEPFDKRGLCSIATQIEGHPDNVVPALLGGLTFSVVTEEDGVFSIVKKAPEKFSFFACIPDFPLSTKESRANLPDTYTMSEVVSALSRAGMTFLCLSEGRAEILEEIFGDVLHEPYRKQNIPGYDEIVKTGKRFGALIAYLSGTGPTIMFILDKDNVNVKDFKWNLSAWLKKKYPHWQLKELPANSQGAEVII